MAIKRRLVWSKTRSKDKGAGKKMSRKKIQKLITKEIEVVRRALGLDRYVIELKFGDIAPPSDDKVAFGEIDVSWEYRDANVKFNDKAIRKYRLQDMIPYYVRHELSHCVTAPTAGLLEHVWDYCRELIEEYETSHIERLPLWEVLDNARKTNT